MLLLLQVLGGPSRPSAEVGDLDKQPKPMQESTQRKSAAEHWLGGPVHADPSRDAFKAIYADLMAEVAKAKAVTMLPMPAAEAGGLDRAVSLLPTVTDQQTLRAAGGEGRQGGLVMTRAMGHHAR